jgi:hypothetical protein
MVQFPMANFLYRSRGLLATIAAALIAGSAVAALAQAPAAGRSSAPVVVEPTTGFKVMVPSTQLTDNLKRANDTRSLVLQVLTGRKTLEDNRTAFDSYYTWYSFPLMTQVTAKALEELPERRNRFFRTEVEYATDPEAHGHLMDLTLGQMTAIVQDTFHPAVRYNAMLIISSLNDQEVVRVGSEKRLPEPMARALPVILAEFQRPENSDAIKVAALIGLSRHLEWDPHRGASGTPIPAALRTQIINELLAQVQAKDPPAGRDAAGHLWFRRRAAEALGFACYAKLEPPVADALDKIVRDATEPLSMRCTVATALGRLNYQAPATLDAVATAKELGYLALVACDAELNRIKNLTAAETDRAARMSGQARLAQGGGAEGFGDAMGGGVGGIPDVPMPGAVMPGAGAGGFGGAGAAFAPADPKGYRFEYVRRRIRQQLYSVQFALTGGDEFDPTRTVAAPSGNTPEAVKLPPRGMVTFAKAGNEKKTVTDIYAKVRELAKVCEEKATDMASLDKELRKSMKSLEAVTKKLAPPPAPTPGSTDPAAPVAVGAGPAALPDSAPSAPAAPAAAATAPPVAPAAAAAP